MKATTPGLAIALALLPRTAHADPFSAHSSGFSSLFGLELRGVGGVAPGVGNGVPVGGALDLVLRVPRGALTLGGRMMWAGTSPYDGAPRQRPEGAQMALGEASLRYFLAPQRPLAFYVAGGAGGGAMYVDGFAYAHARVADLHLAAGAEWPSGSWGRLVGQLRVDLGKPWRREFARPEPAPVLFAVTLQVGFAIGGTGVY